jgi:peptide/nickel transport system permease protein
MLRSTGLALSIGTMVGGALVARSLQLTRLGTTLSGIARPIIPVIPGATLIITIMVLIATFVLDIIYGSSIRAFKPRSCVRGRRR